MAEGGVGDEGDQWERIRMIRRFRELFHGRFMESSAHALLRHHNWEILTAVNFVLDESPVLVQEVLSEYEWEKVTYVRQNQVLADLARRNDVGKEARQYACLDCNHMWWRIVPTRKLVSRCNKCKRKYDAIPRDQEWGWAKFECLQLCGHKFHAFGAMDVSRLGANLHGKSKSICYVCIAHLCEPVAIIQPSRNRQGNLEGPEPHRAGQGGRRRRRRSTETHWCTADNCYNRNNINLQPTRYGFRPGGLPQVPICVHPQSLRKNVVNPSTSHVSTGSTVNTFLSQDELAPPNSPYEPSLCPIEGSDNDGDNA